MPTSTPPMLRVAKALSDVEDEVTARTVAGSASCLGASDAVLFPPAASPPTLERWRTSPPPPQLTAPFRAPFPTPCIGILEQATSKLASPSKAGCGIGYEFSTLRPKGAYVSGAGAYTSGPLSFMDIYDKMCFTVSSAGGRRGAQMATFDVSHPDVFDFVRAKREDGRLRQFNLSLLITEEFIEAVRADGNWDLTFPISAKENRGRH